jgi:hypothetical protein
VFQVGARHRPADRSEPRGCARRHRGRGDTVCSSTRTPAGDGEQYNSNLLYDPDGTLQDHSKQHLVPFGEYVPWHQRSASSASSARSRTTSPPAAAGALPRRRPRHRQRDLHRVGVRAARATTCATAPKRSW